MDISPHNMLNEISRKNIYVVLFYLYIILEIANQSRVAVKTYPTIHFKYVQFI